MSESEVRIKLTAQDTTKTAFNSVQKNIDRTMDSVYGLSTASNRMNSEMTKGIAPLRNVRGAMGQLGYQIQDVAVQLSMGQNALIVFGQQGSQIASIFGPTGAVYGAVIAIASALAGAFFGGAKKATEQVKKLDTSVKALTESMDRLTLRQLQQVRLELEKQAKALQSEAYAEAGGRIEYLNLQLNRFPHHKKAAEWRKELARLKSNSDTYAQALEDVNKQLEKVDLRSAAIKAGEVFVDAETKAKQSVETWEKAVKAASDYHEAQDAIAESIKRSVDPMYAHLENIKKLNVLREEGRLTEIEYAKAVIKSGNAVSQNSAKEIKAKKKQKDEAIKNSFEGFNALAAHNKKLSKVMKVANISRAIMDTYAGANKALASYPPPWGFAMAAGVIASGLANVATIRSQRRFGGSVTAGEPVTVGEQGQETFVPHASGRIEPNGNGGKTINFNITTVDASGFDELLQSRRGMIVNMINRAMNDRGMSGVTS